MSGYGNFKTEISPLLSKVLPLVPFYIHSCTDQPDTQPHSGSCYALMTQKKSLCISILFYFILFQGNI